jgi:hypothetical protein
MKTNEMQERIQTRYKECVEGEREKKMRKKGGKDRERNKNEVG